eukprot:5192495-Pyramimonas_sp.AAC.1
MLTTSAISVSTMPNRGVFLGTLPTNRPGVQVVQVRQHHLLHVGPASPPRLAALHHQQRKVLRLLAPIAKKTGGELNPSVVKWLGKGLISAVGISS